MAPINIIYTCEHCGAEWDDIDGADETHEHQDSVVARFQPWGSQQTFSTWDEAMEALNEGRFSHGS